MPRIMIKCPTTGKPVPTGMDFDRQTFENATLTNNATGCPHCQQTHTWNKADAYLEVARGQG